MLDILSIISAQRIMVLKKYFDDKESSWKVILDGISSRRRWKIYSFL